jgi:hypothetical protein
MQSLRFLDISLLSPSAKKARQVGFHPKGNLICGLNHTGKSTLIKMLFETLGAYPSGKLEGWDSGVISVVTLAIDGVNFRVVRQGSNRGLFAGTDLRVSTSRDREWSRTFGDLTNFSLVLSDKQEKTADADPACFFLPFFINQDGSWGAKWDTFKYLSRFKAPIKPILEFFSQIVPADYYRAKAKRDALQIRIDELDRELKLLRRAKSRLTKSLPALGPKVSEAGFEAEITRLTVAVSELNQKQEGLRLAADQKNDALASIEREIRVVECTLADYAKDEQFIARADLEHLICPVCGAEHAETFLGTLLYAEDARALEQTLLRLKASRDHLAQEIQDSFKRRSELHTEYQRLSDLLETKRGDMKFGQVVEALGAENAIGALEAEEQGIDNATADLLSQLHGCEQDMESYVDKERRRDIVKRFREHYGIARQRLNLNAADTSRMQIYSRPSLSGSGGPRAVLAYYSALWQICSPTGQETFVPPSIPLVIDCPNQQGQDAHNLPAILAFISNRLPHESQVIVTFEGSSPEHFDQQIELTGERSLLVDSEHDTVSADVIPLVDLMQRDLIAHSA